MDELGNSYLCLALHLDRHFEGFIDAYFGPPEVKAQILRGDLRPLDALADDAHQLLALLDASDIPPQRRDLLAVQVGAMLTVIHKLSGRPLDFVQEVERIFDITPSMVDEVVFDAAHAEIDRLLPGHGSLRERLQAWKKRQEIETDRIPALLDLALREIRKRSQSLFNLPPEEDLSLHLVKGQPWSAYNWYLGNYRSRIELNTDLPLRASSVIPLLAHEAYPGHHTEHAIKEQQLYRQQDRGEHAVQLLLAPECVISEGIADNAQGLIFDDTSLAAFMHDQLYPAAGMPDVDVERQIRLDHAAEALRGLGGNAALLLHRDGHPLQEVQQYVEHYGLRTPEEAAQTLKFIQNPLFRAYIFNYADGKALLAPLLQGQQAVDNFRRMLAEPLTPGQVRRWLADLQSS